MLLNDVQGKGLNAIAEASVALGAFREGARRYALPDLTAALQNSVDGDLEEVADTEHDLGEHFITALVLDIAAGGPRTAARRRALPRAGHRRPRRLRARRHARPRTHRPHSADRALVHNEEMPPSRRARFMLVWLALVALTWGGGAAGGGHGGLNGMPCRKRRIEGTRPSQ